MKQRLASLEQIHVKLKLAFMVKEFLAQIATERVSIAVSVCQVSYYYILLSIEFFWTLCAFEHVFPGVFV